MQQRPPTPRIFSFTHLLIIAHTSLQVYNHWAFRLKQFCHMYCNYWAPPNASAFINVKTKPGCKHSGPPLGNLLLLSACKQHQWHIVVEAFEQEVNITGLWQWIFLLTCWIFYQYYLAFHVAYSMCVTICRWHTLAWLWPYCRCSHTSGTIWMNSVF